MASRASFKTYVLPIEMLGIGIAVFGLEEEGKGRNWKGIETSGAEEGFQNEL